MNRMDVLFYAKESQDATSESVSLEEGYTYALWRPGPKGLMPPDAPAMPFAIWSIMHYLRLLGNRDYGLLLVFNNQTVVHRSCVFPRYFRFPFMSKNDLQIGDTWTAKEHRGKGLAKFAIKKIFELTAKPGRRFWYVTDEANIPSIRAAEQAGFTRIGKGRRVNRLGISMIGSYLIET
jgi:RimJ/RimL family protein N-acetyltransferase